MADYWKSQPRKYCEVCQCWFADNKISVEHHERGIRHKANVAKHLREARKKNTEDRRAQESVARELIRIELEAQRAYDKDILEQQLSSSITDPEVKKSLAKVQQKAFKNFSDSATVSSKAQVTAEPGKQGKSGRRGNKETSVDLAAKAKAAFQESYNQRQMKPPAENKLLWWQLVTPEGHPYYYNTVTGETQWEKPDALQQANTTEQTAASSEEQTAYQQASIGTSSEGDATTAGVKRSSNDDTDGGSEVKKPYDGRGYCRGGAYGSWTVVAVREQGEEEEEKEEEKETVEHTLNVKAESSSSSSSSDSEDEGTKEVKEEQDERLFKERTIDSMRNETIKEEPVQPGTFSAFSFKKRTNLKRPQIRQRINENDY